VSYRATIGVVLVVMDPVHLSMKLMQPVEHMISVIAWEEVDVHVTVSFLNAYIQK